MTELTAGLAAPLIGVTGAYGYAMALSADPSDTNLAAAYDALYAARPTAVMPIAPNRYGSSAPSSKPAGPAPMMATWVRMSLYLVMGC